MKHNRLIFACVLLFATHALGGTFTKHATSIRVPAGADGTTNGDTVVSSDNFIRLDANVYIPNGVASPAPVIVLVHGFAQSKSDSRLTTLATDFASAGYVVITPSVRGFGNSEGKVSLVGPNEINDLKTIILDAQTGVIGDSPEIDIPVTSASKFGIMGPSYGGGHAFELMRTHVHGLTAALPIIGWTDLYQALAPNDVPKLTYSLGLFAGGFDLTNPNYSSVMFDWLRDMLDGKPENTRNGDAHHNLDWRSVIRNPSELTIPTFIIQGWQDDLFPAEQAISLAHTNHAIPFLKLYIGGLGHPPASLNITDAEGEYLRDQAVRWFDQWLKGDDTGILDEPPVTIAPDDTKNWSLGALVYTNDIPLAATTTNTYYFNGVLMTPTPPVGPAKFKKIPPTTRFLLVLDPLLRAVGADDNTLIRQMIAVNAIINKDASDILDSKVFTKQDEGARHARFLSNTLPADLHVVGIPQMKLVVASNHKNAYYYVQILERVKKGKTQLITRGAFKDHSNNPSVPHEIDFSLFGVNHVFKAGGQISLLISSRDYPFFLPNLDQETVKIYRDSVHSSSISLPVVP